jgi:signal transduction histidine kinase
MPDTPYLLAILAVVLATAFAFLVGRRASERLRDLDEEVTAVRAELGEARSELAGARAEADRLTEQLRQAEERPPLPAPHAGGRHVEVFVNLSRRLQSLVHREIKLLDALENEVEDPDLLKGLFQVDHLATRIRRHAENLAVLGGSVSRRQWSRPVALTEVLRSSIAEVEQYSRVKLVPPIEGTIPGHAVASVIHLIAELIENATMFAPPQTQVLLRAQAVTSGVAIEVEDRGLGMQRADQDRVNQLLANPDDFNLDDLLRDGRIGLYVVSVIARQHGIAVQLQTNIYGGVQAVIILPPALLGPSVQDVAQTPRSPGLTQDTTEIAHQALWPTSPSVSPPPATPAPPSHAAASHAAASHALPTRAAPARVAPAHVAPAHVAPAHVAPAHVAPAHVTPARVAPAQVSPAHLVPTQAVPIQVAPAESVKPPLPRRRSQSHMVPQLKLGVPQPPKDPVGEHDLNLMASFMNGVSQGEAAPADAER